MNTFYAHVTVNYSDGTTVEMDPSPELTVEKLEELLNLLVSDTDMMSSFMLTVVPRGGRE